MIGTRAASVQKGLTITSPIQLAGLRVWLDASQLGLADGAAVTAWPT